MMRRLFLAFGLLAAACAAALGAVGSVSFQQVTVTPNSSAYSAGQCVGGVLTVPAMVQPQGPGGTEIVDVSLVDPQHQTAANDAMTLLVFNALPGGTYTDHSNCQVAAGDLPNLVGSISIASSNCVQDEGPATTVCTVPATLFVNKAMPVANSSLYVVPIAVATPTYGSAATLYFNFTATPFVQP